ncbi:hypothetical protein K432DRAFT_379409 [Lepidopterella palustris CBS 459.81]|uniref:FAR-17a/AIG1-like protein n=1 Tax=Lepidopterella palustris CBS 459.81 TaxID=1314670 RepID=A0A8E2EGU5_9PEZI|nr:hypothetical protein K432DRAFT_379409 [Lepidopterella palustris CBS 459.81]
MAGKKKPDLARPPAPATVSKRADLPPPNMASVQLHFIALISYAISFEHLISRPNKINQGFGGHFQFLTNISLALSTLVSILGALVDLTRSRSAQALKSRVLFLITPIEALITLSYWSVYLYDVSLIVDSRMGPLISLYKDIGFHLLPFIFLLIDLLYFSPRYFLPPLPSFAVFAGFLSLYRGVWLEICVARNGWVPYPVLAELSAGREFTLWGVCAALAWGASMGLRGLCGALDG